MPQLVVDSGEETCRRYVEFFAATIRNKNTRVAYLAANSKFLDWSQSRGVTHVAEITPFVVAAYIESLTEQQSAPTVKQALAAIRMLFDYLVIGHVIATNPASSVRGPRHVVKKGKSPVLTPDEVRKLINSIDICSITGLRDRALISTMVYSFARVGAVVALNTNDYFQQGRRMWFRLREKGGKRHDVPVHHKAEEYFDAYLSASDDLAKHNSPVFRTVDRRKNLTDRRIHRREVLAMIKRRCSRAGLPSSACCHSFRATGITTYLEQGGTLEHAQHIAAHESPRTTKLYDRTGDDISLEEIERIRF